MNSFKLFGFKRKLRVFSPIEGFFEFHSSPKERKKIKTGKKQQFFSKLKKFK